MTELNDYRNLQTSLEFLINNNVTTCKTLIEIGSSVLGEAFIPSTSSICIKIGLGFFVEMTLPEALRHSKSMIESFTSQLTEIDRQIVETHQRLQSLHKELMSMLERLHV
ncbi:hypothetical protein GEMRC1_013472 [Eukaryota sp. GEM-RC1]